MKKIILLIGLIYASLINLTPERAYSMSGKRMEERPKETSEGLDRLREKEAAEKEAEEPGEYVVKPLEQPDIIVNEENIGGLYRELSDRGGTAVVRRYPESYTGDYYEVYTGEILGINSIDPTKARLVKYPYMSENETFIKENLVFFQTYYQGDYSIEVEDKSGNKRVVEVRAKHKYNFTEEQNYDIILNSYGAKNIEVFLPAKELFILSYPNSFAIRDIYFMEAELYIDLKKSGEAREAIQRIRGEYKLTAAEDEKLILLEEKTLDMGSRAWKNYLYRNRKTGDLEKKLLTYLHSGVELEGRDLELLKGEYRRTHSKKTAQIIGDYYAEAGDRGEALRYLAYAEDYEKICRIYLKNREIELFDKTLSKVKSSRQGDLVAEKERLLKTIEVERELELGRIRFESNNYQEAILFFDRAKRRNPEISEKLGVELDLGMSYYNLFDYEKAVEHLLRVEETTKDSYKGLEADYYVAMSYYRGENREESLRYFQKIVKDYPETSWAKKSMIYIIRLRKE